jgi:signal transduction histidine kinase/ActR/RegA family two-component response regulator
MMQGWEADPTSRLLVLMPTPRDSERTVALLREASVRCLVCRDLPELCSELRAGAGAVLVTDEAIFQDQSGLLPAALRDQPAWSALPVLVLARDGWDRRKHRLSSDAFKNLIVVERPVRTRTLVSVVTSALRARRQQYEIRDAMLLRERQAAELMVQDERLRFALSAGGLGSWELDLLTYQLDCSDICRANFGRSEPGPFSYDDLRASIHVDDRELERAALERSIATRTDYDIEYRIAWPDGEVHWVLVRGRSIYDQMGRPRRMLGVSLDITERKRIHEALQQSELELVRQAEELKRANRRKDEFLATLAHELRNPLAPIRTGLDLLARSPEPEVQQRTLGVMHRQITHMVRLIDDLLDVSRITRGKFELKRQRIHLASALSAAIEASKPLIDRKQQTLRVEAADESLWLDADLTRVAQVIGNLLNNASNYTPSGGLIELSAQREQGEVVIRVRDNGIGVPPDRLEDVFEMFSQLNGALETSQVGLGIGLALVRSLVEMHGGSVSAESEGPGKGSTFSVRFPLAAERGSVESEADAVNAASTTGARVLVVDDNEDAADLLSLLLAQSGYQTRTAHDGPSALSGVEAFQPDIVILDIGLPGMSGYDVARALRRDQRFSALILVALTGWGSPEDRQQALSAGFDLHLTKPVDANALRADLSVLRPAAS